MKKLMSHPIIAAVVAAAIFAAPLAPAQASVETSMDGFWTGSLGSANLTGPSAFQGQSANYYSAGNLVYRAPQETAQIATMQLPGVKAGCGGIDIFAGSFSFISSDQIVATAKAVASNSVGYAFQLALSSLCPTCATLIQDLQDTMNKVNQFNINSCQTAQALVNGMAGRAQAQNDALCSNLTANQGTFSDRIASRVGCAANMVGATNALNATSKAQLPINKNLGWEAAKNHPFLAADSTLAETFMTLTGTVIYRCPDNNGCTINVLPAAAKDSGVVTKLLDGGTFVVHDCNDAACLQPAEFAQSVTIPANKSLRRRAQTMLEAITQKVDDRQVLTPEERDFVNLAGLPVLKMASVYEAQMGVGNAKAMMVSYADAIAIELVYNWIENGVNDIQDGARNVQGVNEDQRQLWEDSVDSLRADIGLKRQLQTQKIMAIDTIVARAQAAEQMLAMRVQTRMGGALQFTNSLGTR